MRIKRRNPEAKWLFLRTVSLRSQAPGHLLGRKALLQPERGGGSAAQRPPVNAPEPQQVEQDGQHDHQEAAREQVVIVDKGEAPPVRVTRPEGLLLDISGRTETKANSAVRERDSPGKRRDATCAGPGPQGAGLGLGAADRNWHRRLCHSASSPLRWRLRGLTEAGCKY